jgi:DNA-binding LacI/PurR family transcriptional regulator
MVEVAGATCFPVMLGSEYDSEFPKLVRKQGVTAYWVINDYEASRVEMRCIKDGLDVPGDVSIIGRWDTPWSRSALTPLSTVSIDPEATSKTIADLFVDIAGGASKSGGVVRVKPKLIVRESSGGAPADGR